MIISGLFTVEGQSPEQVDATFSAIRDDLMKLSSSFGGPMFRVFFFLTALTIGVSLFLRFAELWLQTRRNNYLLPILIIACLAALVIVLPIQEALAGFSAINGDPSIAVRYGPEIALLSLIIAIVAIPLSLLPLWTQKKLSPLAEVHHPAPTQVPRARNRNSRDLRFFQLRQSRLYPAASAIRQPSCASAMAACSARGARLSAALPCSERA